MIYRKSGGWEKDFDGPPQEKISESRAQHETRREEFSLRLFGEQTRGDGQPPSRIFDRIHNADNALVFIV